MIGLTAHKTAFAALEEIEDIRARVTESKVVLAELAAMPVPQAEAEAALDAALARLSERGAEAFTITSLTRPRLRPDFAPELSHSDVVALLIGLNAQAVRKVVGAKLKAFYAGRTVLAPEDRDTRAAKAKAELLKLELAEEAAIRRAEAAGLPVDRRADADPRAVLALIKV